MNTNPLVLVTGGSGFVASHCIVRLLRSGYAVRTTVRSLNGKEEVIRMVKRGGVVDASPLSFIEADLLDDSGWDDAVRGCTYVLHVASPVAFHVKDDNELIRPAVEGTLRVLKAARRAAVKRVVVTSSFAAVGAGPSLGRPFCEEDWTDPDVAGISAYAKSKTIAERAAWNFIRDEGGPMEMSVINPVAIFGPILGTRFPAGQELLRRLLDGSLKRCPQSDLELVDVRDVADLHLLAMTSPHAAGRRFLALAGGRMTFHEIALLLREKLGANAAKVTKQTVSSWPLRIATLWSGRARQRMRKLSEVRESSNELARTVLSWNPRPNEEAIVSAAKSFIEIGKHL